MKQYENRTYKRIRRFRRRKRNIIYVLAASILILLLVICLLCNIFYQIGYDHKFEEEYDSMYRVVRHNTYYEGYMEGLSAVRTDGIERKTKLIAAYNSLIRYENLSEIDQKAFTYRLNELLRSPVPEEEKVEKFIEDVQKILSSDT